MISDLDRAEYRWTNVTMDGPFRPRDGAVALVYRNRMWLIGGWNPSDKEYYPRICANDVWSTADGSEWTLERPNTFLDDSFDATKDWEGTHTAGYVVFRDRMWIVGGDPLQGHYQCDVWSSDDGRIWELMNGDGPVPWCPRALHYTLVHDGRIWVIGGQTLPQYAPAEDIIYHDVWNTADGVNWEKVEMETPFQPPRGMTGGSAVLHGRMWLLGGGIYQSEYYNDVWSSPDGSNWQLHTGAAPWAPRQYHDVAAFNDRLWVLEGAGEDANRNDVWYSSDGVNWYEVPDTPWKIRHASSIFVFNDALWVVVGNNMESDVWKLERVHA